MEEETSASKERDTSFADVSVSKEDFDKLKVADNTDEDDEEAKSGGSSSPDKAAISALLEDAEIQAISLQKSLARHDSAGSDEVILSEENVQRHWKDEEKQVFILTSAGKPVFMRYGDESELMSLMGVIQAIIGRCQANKAELNQIIMNRRRFVFLLDGPLYLVAICKTDEPEAYLRRQLLYLKQQILQLLSAQIYKMLKKRPNYDFRNLMGDMRRFMEGILQLADSSPHILCESFAYQPLARSDRSKISSILSKARRLSSKLLFGVLLLGSKVVTYVETRGMSLPEADMILIINFVRSSSSLSSESAVHFTPLCLPTFNGGFLQTYVGMLSKDLCLLLFSMTTEPAAAFPELTSCKDAVHAQLSQEGLYDKISESRTRKRTSVVDLDIPDLVHFVYVFCGHCKQHFCPDVHPEWNDAKSRTRLWRRYQDLHTRFHDTVSGPDPHNHICDRNDRETIVCTRGHQYELYATFRPLVPIADASKGCDRILKWVKGHQESLFVSKSAVWAK